VKSSVHVIDGRAIDDTIESLVRVSALVEPVSANAIVRFQVYPCTIDIHCTSVDLLDASGTPSSILEESIVAGTTASTVVRLPQRSGTSRIIVTARANSTDPGVSDTATITVRPGNVVRVRFQDRDLAVFVGDSLTVRGGALDRRSNDVPLR
jgi:hypothetical protein